MTEEPEVGEECCEMSSGHGMATAFRSTAAMVPCIRHTRARLQDQSALQQAALTGLSGGKRQKKTRRGHAGEWAEEWGGRVGGGVTHVLRLVMQALPD